MGSRSWLYNTVIAFSERTLPREAWTHKSHIIVAFWHNWYLEYDEAYENVKEKIKAYNEATGMPNTETSGYHDTLTHFWLILTKNYIAQHSFGSVDDACTAFLRTDSFASDYPLKYYSEDVLFSLKARKEWVQGDKQTLEKTWK